MLSFLKYLIAYFKIYQYFILYFLKTDEKHYSTGPNKSGTTSRPPVRTVRPLMEEPLYKYFCLPPLLRQRVLFCQNYLESIDEF